MKAGVTPLNALSLLDVEALRLILLGSSVVDWQRLAFTNREDVDHFLALYRFDPVADEQWMRGVLRDAVEYLTTSFRVRVPSEVAEPEAIADLFLYASGALKPQFRKISCIVLKACHVIHHIEARDLFHRLPLSEEAFGEMAEAQVMAVFAEMKRDGFPIEDASSSAKSRTSLISKLLQKADTLAARIYDRTRFRVTVSKRDDVLPLLHGLTQRLFPFHMVVPGQTQNSLIDFREVCARTPNWAPLIDSLQFGIDFDIGTQAPEKPENAFSGATYRMLKFVVDMPLRIDASLISPDIAAATRARTVCCQVEIQLVDADTARANQEGDNNHASYKERQKQSVFRRLSRGLGASVDRTNGPWDGPLM